MEWMCCNSCGISVRKNKNNFHVTRCGHFFCSTCIKKAVETCTQCKAEGQPSLSLRDPLECSINGCFVPLDDVAQKISQVTQFQSVQWHIAHRNNDPIDGKYEALKKEYWRLSETLNLYKQKNAKYLKVFDTLQANIKKMEQKLSIPRNHVSDMRNGQS